MLQTYVACLEDERPNCSRVLEVQLQFVGEEIMSGGGSS